MSSLMVIFSLWAVAGVLSLMFIAGAARLNREPRQIVHRYHAVPRGWHPAFGQSGPRPRQCRVDRSR